MNNINKFIAQITDSLYGPAIEISEDDIFKMIADNYLKLIVVNNFNNFKFKSYTNNKQIIVDSIDININIEDNEILNEIDYLINSLNFDCSKSTYTLILKRIEEVINNQINA